MFILFLAVIAPVLSVTRLPSAEKLKAVVGNGDSSAQLPGQGVDSPLDDQELEFLNKEVAAAAEATARAKEVQAQQGAPCDQALAVGRAAASVTDEQREKVALARSRANAETERVEALPAHIQDLIRKSAELGTQRLAAEKVAEEAKQQRLASEAAVRAELTAESQQVAKERLEDRVRAAEDAHALMVAAGLKRQRVLEQENQRIAEDRLHAAEEAANQTRIEAMTTAEASVAQAVQRFAKQVTETRRVEDEAAGRCEAGCPEMAGQSVRASCRERPARGPRCKT